MQLEEDLEQLKVLENGYKMKVQLVFLDINIKEAKSDESIGYLFSCFLQVIKVDHDAHGVDTPEDVAKIENYMRERNLS